MVASVLDGDFNREQTSGFAEFAAVVDELGWQEIVHRSGIARKELELIADVYAQSNATIFCYGVGLTQHPAGVKNVRLLCNLMLLRGNIGKPGAGICPVRGHSNIQGQRTVGWRKAGVGAAGHLRPILPIRSTSQKGDEHGRYVRGGHSGPRSCLPRTWRQLRSCHTRQSGN